MSKKEIKTRRRGIRFPMHPLEEALKVAEAVLGDGGGSLSLETTAKSLELSEKGSAFYARVSSAKHYGLITSVNKILKITPLAVQILRPTSQDERETVLRNAFKNFKVFNTLYERFEGNLLPKKDILENILVREYGVSDVSKNIAYKSFLESGKYIGLIKESEEGNFCGILKKEKEDIEGEIEIEEEVREKLEINSMIIEFLDKIGSLKMIVKLYEFSLEDKKEVIKTIFKDIITRALKIATDLDLPALKMSLKITSDNLNTIPFENIGQFITYIDEGIKEDLGLKNEE